jgi:hypothetical protein
VEASLKSNWDGQAVAFFANTSYSCANTGLFFENSRAQVLWNMTCLPGGKWAIPSVWPVCLTSKISSVINFA